MNEWKFSGEIVRLKELDNSKNFKANITLRGSNIRKDINCTPVELGCMVPRNVYNHKIKLYKQIEAYGHFETWTHITEGGNIKSTLSRVVDGFKAL